MAKNVLFPYRSTAADSATDAAIQKKLFGLGRRTTLIISNEEVNDVMEISKSLEESGLLIIGVRKTIRNYEKRQRGRFLDMLLGTLRASLLGNLLTGKGVKAKIPGRGVIRGDEGTTRAG